MILIIIVAIIYKFGIDRLRNNSDAPQATVTYYMLEKKEMKKGHWIFKISPKISISLDFLVFINPLTAILLVLRSFVFQFLNLKKKFKKNSSSVFFYSSKSIIFCFCRTWKPQKIGNQTKTHLNHKFNEIILEKINIE